jgi:hypothetical protein
MQYSIFTGVLYTVVKTARYFYHDQLLTLVETSRHFIMVLQSPPTKEIPKKRNNGYVVSD